MARKIRYVVEFLGIEFLNNRQKYVLDSFRANVPDSIYFKDRESRITHANQAHARLMGFNDPSEEVGKSDFDFFPIVGQHEDLLVVRQGGQVERVDTINLGFPIGLEEHIATWGERHLVHGWDHGSRKCGQTVVRHRAAL
jgi:PAS domain-containing protein